MKQSITGLRGTRTRAGLVALVNLATVALLGFSTSPGLARQSPTSPADQGAAALHKGDTVAAVAQFTDALSDTALTSDRRAALLNDRGVAFMRLGQSKRAKLGRGIGRRTGKGSMAGHRQNIQDVSRALRQHDLERVFCAQVGCPQVNIHHTVPVCCM